MPAGSVLTGTCLEDDLAHTVDLVTLNASVCLYFNYSLAGCLVTGLKVQRLNGIHVLVGLDRT